MMRVNEIEKGRQVDVKTNSMDIQARSGYSLGSMKGNHEKRRM
jgi:hypothetical protein